MKKGIRQPHTEYGAVGSPAGAICSMPIVMRETATNDAGKPAMIRPELNPRRFFGEYSIASGLAAVYSPPMKMPITNRRITKATPNAIHQVSYPGVHQKK